MINNRGFSLIEMMVALGIMVLMSGGALTFFNSYSAHQKVKSAKQELEDNLILARNYARGLKVPPGFGDTGAMNYVAVNLTNGGVLTLRINGVGASYFSRDISGVGVSTTTISGEQILFSPYEGKLIYTNLSGVLESRLSSYQIGIGISSVEGGGSTETVIVNAFGLVNGK